MLFCYAPLIVDSRAFVSKTNLLENFWKILNREDSLFHLSVGLNLSHFIRPIVVQIWIFVYNWFCEVLEAFFVHFCDKPLNFWRAKRQKYKIVSPLLVFEIHTIWPLINKYPEIFLITRKVGMLEGFNMIQSNWPLV